MNESLILFLTSVSLILTSGEIFGTTLTVYSLGTTQCKYMLADNNTPIATWTAGCSSALGPTTYIDIMERSELGRKLKKINRPLDLKNIRVTFVIDPAQIRNLESLNVREIKLRRFDVAKNFHITTSSDAGHKNSIASAQDYNSSRSNKANSIAPAQDYNSSRSNKANSIAPAQDNNSPRINKANSIAPAQDYDSSRSNKANAVVPVGDYNSSRSNKANSIAPAQDYNSSRSNKANAVVSAQDYNSSKSKKGGMIIEGGFTRSNTKSPISNGFSFSLGYMVPINNILSIETNIAYFSNKFNYKPVKSLPENLRKQINNSIQNNRWNSYALMAGPSATFGRTLTALVYARMGIAFPKIPDQYIGVANEKGTVTEASGMVKFSVNKSTTAFNAGVRLNHQLSHRISLFINPCFFTI